MLYPELYVFHWTATKIVIKPLLCNIQHVYIVHSDIQLNNTHSIHCCVSTTTMPLRFVICTLPVWCVWCGGLGTNCRYVSTEHWQIDFFNREFVCLLRGTKWMFKYLLTPRCRVLPVQLTGLQLIKKFTAFHATRRFITALTSVRHLSLSWASPMQFTYPHPTSWRSILILYTHLRLGLPRGLLTLQSAVTFLLTYLLTYSMVQSPSWAATWFAASQEIPRISRNPNVHHRDHNRPPPGLYIRS